MNRWTYERIDPPEDEEEYEMGEDQSSPEMDDYERKNDPDEMLDKRFEQFEAQHGKR